MRVRLSPMRTARVSLPVTASVGMSRRLLTTSSAVAKSPTGTATAKDSPVNFSSCT
ncbi:unannotated protein [freshwater metagenome]|uniref:Unannotated protein n=1 Tax=freshwater metagenome TaxID=449393 RepID=A0A6J7AV98_9ZZZZ